MILSRQRNDGLVAGAVGADGAEMIADVDQDAPLRLSDAAAIAFPNGGMTASGLRREAAKGRLAVSTIARKQFTTLRAIKEMINTCQDDPRERAYVKPADAKSTSVWIIKDGKHRESTGRGPSELGKAEQALNDYITRKYRVPRLQKAIRQTLGSQT